MAAEVMESASLLGFFLVIGAVVGMISGVVGAGAGALLAPSLYFAFDALGYAPAESVKVALGTSLAAIALLSLFAARVRQVQGALDAASFMRRFSLFFALGGGLGAAAAVLLSGDWLLASIGAIGFAAALWIFFGEGAGARLASEAAAPSALPVAVVASGAAGALGGLGGGLATAPVWRSGGARHLVAAHSAAAGAAFSLPAALVLAAAGVAGEMEGGPPFSLGYVNLAALGVIAPMISVCAPMGAQLTMNVSRRALRIGFAFLLAIISLSLVRRAGLA